MNADHIKKLLALKYSLPTHLFMSEVKRSTGYRKPERFVDGISIGLYPSKGCLVEGFEIKTSRSDLLTELRDPSKAEETKQFCDKWWLVIPDIQILNGREQIPDDWGVMIASHHFLTVHKKAADLVPEGVDRYFLASLLRNAKYTMERNLKEHLKKFGK